MLNPSIRFHPRFHRGKRARRAAGPALFRSLAAATALMALTVLTACGAAAPTDNPGAAPERGGSFPVSVLSGPVDSGKQLKIETRPTSIVSLSPTATEMLFAIGAGEQVVAVDDQSDYPKNAPKTDLSGFTPNIEAILGYSPDLVVAADDLGGLVAGLGEAKVPTLLVPTAANLDEAYSQIERLGAATGHVEQAASVAGEMRKGIEDAIASVSGGGKGLAFYHELDPGLVTVTSKTFVGQLYAEFGLKNIADAANAGTPYPQLNAEYVVQSNPDLIFLADNGLNGVSVDNVGERPGWANLKAVRNDGVVAVNPDLSSRWGPRLGEFAELIADTIAAQQKTAR